MGNKNTHQCLLKVVPPLSVPLLNRWPLIVTYIGNLVIGGANSTAAVGGTGFATLHEAPTLEFASSRILDNNIRIESYRLGREGSYVYRHR